MAKHLYGMRLRGFSPGCQPLRGLVERRDSEDGRYYDILVYRRKLREYEEKNSDLDYLGMEED